MQTEFKEGGKNTVNKKKEKYEGMNREKHNENTRK